MRKNKNYRFESANDAGVALIFALALLALLLIMVIGFMATNILEQRIAYNQSSGVSSKLIARSALARVKTQLKAYSDDIFWMRFRPTEKTPPAKYFSPIVSLPSGTADTGGITGSVNGTVIAAKTAKPGADSAFEALSKVLEENVALDNWFPADADYPQWIYMSVQDGAARRLTGRMAYAVLPNLGIDFSLLGNGTGIRKGVDYDELPITGLTFLPANAPSFLGKNYLTPDFLLTSKGLTSFNQGSIKTEFESGSTSDTEITNVYLTARQMPRRNNAWKDNGTTRYRINNTITFDDAKKILGDDFKPTEVRDQVAANLVDYVDTDNTPYSDQTGDWTALTGTAHPKYTGNEKTPYLNQIVPMIEIQSEYTCKRTIDPDDSSKSTIDRTWNITSKAVLAAELINIYAQALPADEVVLKDMELTCKIDLYRGETVEKTAEIKLTSPPEGIVITNTGNADAQSYKVITKEVNLDPAVITMTEDLAATAEIPEIKCAITVQRISFSRAILKANGGNADYVIGQTKDEPNGVFSIVNTNPQPIEPGGETPELIDEAKDWLFGALEGSATVRTATVSAYASFEVEDPRCNLEAEKWEVEYLRDWKALASFPNEGAKNSKAEPKNTETSQITAKDMEEVEDPALGLSTAVITNKPMVSPWELGFIHRGEPWKTLNLKSAADPGSSDYASQKGTYIDDASILDRVKMETDTGMVNKYNINHPAVFISAFGPLAYNLKVHLFDDLIVDSANTLQIEGSTALTVTQAQDLQKWLANKCYKAAAADPTAGEKYDRYIHRGMLANVITDWALSNKSPYDGKKISDAMLEELVSKIAPLTHCGDTFEYFTVLAVGQAIKDAGPADGNESANAYVKYSGVDKIEQKCKLGRWDDKFDQVTGETFMVARLRRSVNHCENTVNCQNGIHDPKCTFKVNVLESYTLSDLD